MATAGPPGYLLALVASLGVLSITCDAAAKAAARVLRREDNTGSAGDAQESPQKIWCYYEYPNGAPANVKLNMETWRRHGPEMEIVMVNDSNVKRLIPDLPSEYFMLPYASAKSDVLRAALLYHHGGLYMDTDYLVMRPLREFVSKLAENDIVAASDDENSVSQACGRYFSSNFMAGRRGNGFSMTWWENIKRKLRAKCPAGGFAREKVCCHEEGENASTKHEQCHIPWASLEHMKQPEQAGQALISLSTTLHTEAELASESDSELRMRSSISRLAPEFLDHLPEGLKLFCFQGNQTLTPHLNGEIYWQSWDGDSRSTGSVHDKAMYDDRFSCHAEEGSVDLQCTRGNWGTSNRIFYNFFDRPAYHLFFSSGQRASDSRENAFKNSWLVSALWRRSLGFDDSGNKKKLEHASLVQHEEPYRIWAYYEYPDGPSPFVQLNLETWRRHAPGVRIELVNESNARHFIPDLPDDFFRLGYASAKSDVMRAALLYHHGGLYMDTDFLLMKPIADVFAKLKENDVVSYMDNNDVQSGQCKHDAFSSNFIAGQKGNEFSRIWWSNIKVKLAQVCTRDEWEHPNGKICCHLEGETPEDLKSRHCNIPWASIEHMKDPVNAHSVLQLETSSLLQRASTQASGHMARGLSHLSPDLTFELPSSLRMYCLAGNNSLVPHINGEIMWQPWDSHQGITASRVESSRDLKLYDQRFRCQRVSGPEEAMECSKGNWGPETRVMYNFFGRPAYHLFFSTTNKWANTKMDILNMDWLLSEMYRRSLGLAD